MLPKEGHHVSDALPDPVQIEVGLGRMFTRRLDLFRWTEQDDSSMVPRLRYDWACRFSGDPLVAHDNRISRFEPSLSIHTPTKRRYAK
jgi:hypothetical protein